MPTAFNNIADELRKKYASDQEKSIADNEALYANKVNSTNQLYDAQLDKQKNAYDNSYRENAIQKLINERKVAENMANLGLTNSGLNRTQQTAVQLSYANQKAAIDRSRQSAIDDINLSRTQALDTIEQNRISGEAAIRQNYEDMINQTAQNIYKEQLDAETKIIQEQLKYQQQMQKEQLKQQQQNSYIIKQNNALLSKNYSGTLKDNGIDSYRITKNENDYVRYVDKNSGKSLELPVGFNPYTGDNNLDGTSKKDTALAGVEYGTFENGYQPKGVFYNGKNYGWVSHSGLWDEIYGNEQRVHQTKDGSLWIWDGRNNMYIPYVSNSK